MNTAGAPTTAEATGRLSRFPGSGNFDRNLGAPGMARAPLVLGECVQGQRSDGVHFLITSPIHLHSTARFIPDLEIGKLIVEPEARVKSLRAVRRYLEEEELPASGILRIRTPLVPSHGFGTSSADIAAGIRAAARAWGRTASPERISGIAIGIEPTDGLMYPGSVVYAHREGRLLESLGVLPRFSALAAYGDTGVDTVAFDAVRTLHRYTPREIDRLEAACKMVRRATRHRDFRLMARASSLSARISQRLLPKPLFGEMERLVTLGVADGLMAAHSGSALALLLDARHPRLADREEIAARHMERLGVRRWIRVRGCRDNTRCSLARMHDVAASTTAEEKLASDPTAARAVLS